MNYAKDCPVCGEKARINTELSVRPLASCDNPECWMFGFGYHLEDWNKPRFVEDTLKEEASQWKKNYLAILDWLASERANEADKNELCD